MATKGPVVGIEYVGLGSSGAFAFVDVDARTIEKQPASLHRSLGSDRLIARDGWVAIDAHDSLWAVSAAFDEKPTLIVRSFIQVPRPDGFTVWVVAPGEDDSGRLLAADRDRNVHAAWDLPEGWTRLEAELTEWMLVSRGSETGPASEIGGVDESGAVRTVAASGIVLATHEDRVVWAQSGLRHADRIVAEHIVISDLNTGSEITVRVPEIAEWQRVASFTPDGAQLALAGHVDPSPTAHMTREEARAGTGRTLRACCAGTRAAAPHSTSDNTC